MLAGLALQHHANPSVREIGNHFVDWWWRGAAEPLDDHMGLRSHGGVSAQRAIALNSRDRMLRNLHRSMSDWRDLAPAAAARLMVLSAKRYEDARWPRERDAMSAPPSEPAATWWRILRAGGAVPGAKRLSQILGMEIQPPL